VSAGRQVAAAACAAGLALTGVATASAAKVEIVDRPAERFQRAIDAHVERVEERAERRAERRAEAQDAATPSPESLGVSQATLDAIAACESGGDPTAVNAAGYYGKYQFDLGTWASVGGSGNPADAPESEQDYRAALLYSRAGSSPWPLCGA
jgi:soluble lytic murein transglycosylase-like protein